MGCKRVIFPGLLVVQVDLVGGRIAKKSSGWRARDLGVGCVFFYAYEYLKGPLGCRRKLGCCLLIWRPHCHPHPRCYNPHLRHQVNYGIKCNLTLTLPSCCHYYQLSKPPLSRRLTHSSKHVSIRKGETSKCSSEPKSEVALDR